MNLEQILKEMNDITNDKDIHYMVLSIEDVKALKIYIHQLEQVIQRIKEIIWI